ncbi:MAG: hypothetical protein WC753_02600 [Candidatus Gracilibacteria bacterium]
MILPPGEKIIETKKCRISGEDFFVTDKDLEFLDKVSPIFGGEKYSLPSLDVSPLEMRKTLLSFRNQNRLYKRKCSKTGQEIIAMFSSEVPFPVYEKSLWYSDSWNPMEYGQDVDFNKTFFEQWSELNDIVPHPANSRLDDENSIYSNNCGNVKDCYLCFNGLFNENCLYCQIWDYSKNCIDCECIFECENCYTLNLSKKCYNCWYSHELTNCGDCILCYDCIGCNNCIGCYNLRNKKNYLFNQPSTPEAIKEYKKKNNISLLSINSLKKVISQGVHKYASMVQSEECFGNEFQSSKNCFDCYYMMGAEDCAYCDSGKEQKDCRYVMNGMKNLENSYCSVTVGINASNIFFCNNSTRSLSDILYCSFLFSGVHHCFGCISLHNHEHHCIFNTSYSAQEYETLCGKLVEHMRSTGEWGQFFPRQLSAFEYNESLAHEYFPLSQDEAIQGGWKWRTEETVVFTGNIYSPLPIAQYDERIVGFDTATKNIAEVLAGTLQCEVTKKPFKLVSQELAFYIENNLPLPTKHPDQRHKERLSLRNGRMLHERTCTDCKKPIISIYAPNVPERVVCEECYQKLIY